MLQGEIKPVGCHSFEQGRKDNHWLRLVWIVKSTRYLDRLNINSFDSLFKSSWITISHFVFR